MKLRLRYGGLSARPSFPFLVLLVRLHGLPQFVLFVVSFCCQKFRRMTRLRNVTGSHPRWETERLKIHETVRILPRKSSVSKAWQTSRQLLHHGPLRSSRRTWNIPPPLIPPRCLLEDCLFSVHHQRLKSALPQPSPCRSSLRCEFASVKYLHTHFGGVRGGGMCQGASRGCGVIGHDNTPGKEGVLIVTAQ